MGLLLNRAGILVAKNMEIVFAFRNPNFLDQSKEDLSSGEEDLVREH